MKTNKVLAVALSAGLVLGGAYVADTNVAFAEEAAEKVKVNAVDAAGKEVFSAEFDSISEAYRYVDTVYREELGGYSVDQEDGGMTLNLKFEKEMPKKADLEEDVTVTIHFFKPGAETPFTTHDITGKKEQAFKDARAYAEKYADEQGYSDFTTIDNGLNLYVTLTKKKEVEPEEEKVKITAHYFKPGEKESFMDATFEGTQAEATNEAYKFGENYAKDNGFKREINVDQDGLTLNIYLQAKDKVEEPEEKPEEVTITANYFKPGEKDSFVTATFKGTQSKATVAAYDYARTLAKDHNLKDGIDVDQDGLTLNIFFKEYKKEDKPVETPEEDVTIKVYFHKPFQNKSYFDATFKGKQIEATAEAYRYADLIAERDGFRKDYRVEVSEKGLRLDVYFNEKEEKDIPLTPLEPAEPIPTPDRPWLPLVPADPVPGPGYPNPVPGGDNEVVIPGEKPADKPEDKPEDNKGTEIEKEKPNEGKDKDEKAKPSKEKAKPAKQKGNNPKTGLVGLAPIYSTLAISMAGIVAARKKND